MGFGTDPLGTSPFGIGTPVAAQPLPEGPAGSRYLDPLVGDYRVGQLGQLGQMPPVRQRVLLALRTLRGSSTVLPGFGLVLPRKLDEKAEANVRNAVLAALRRMTDVERVLRVESVVAQKHPGGRLAVLVAFSDLTTGQRDTVSTVLS